MSAGTDEAPNYAWRALERCERGGPASAVVADGGRWSYPELAARVRGVAATLWEHGVRSGSTVGVVAFNPPESLFLQLALHLLGCRSAWVAHNAPAGFRREFVHRAGLDTFVYDARTLPDLGADLAAEPAAGGGALRVFCFGAGAGPDLAAASPATRLPFDRRDVRHAPDSLFQTGGTTGVPKLVHHPERFFAALLAMSDAHLADDRPPLRHLLLSGTWHVSAQTAAFLTLFSGGTLVLQDGFEVGPFLAAIERERINSTLLVPPMLVELLDDPRLAAADCSSLTTLSIAGAPAAPARLAAAAARFGPVVRVVYGMSEAPFITALPALVPDPARPHRMASCGPPYPGVAVRILPPDTDNPDTDNPATDGDCPPGADGEVWVRGPLVMAGYHGEPALTARTLVDGWLRTGDLGHLRDGELYLVDRVKDMIVTGSGSTNVYSRPVENALCAHPAVRAAAVVGVPHPLYGEAVHAFVVPVPGQQPDPAALRAHVVAQLNETWAPGVVELVAALPLTGSGKVDKKALRARGGVTLRTPVMH